MKRLLFVVCAIFGFIACTQNPIEEQSAIRTDVPETIKVGFEDNETRIQLNEAQKTVWTKNDLVSVFYKSDANQMWEYRGETGERVAELYRVDAGTASSTMNYVVLAYPYSTDYVLSTATGNIETTLPAIQHYAAGSYGIGENLMVSRSEFTQFSLKSVCGWLKLQLTGNGEVVKSIKFRGNNGEQVAGLIYVDTATAEATLASEMGGTDDNNAGGNLVFDDTILTEVVLDCGEGVELGAKATHFYISLPPQTFANGFTVEIECKDYKLMRLTTEKELVIERNHIQPMASVECDATPNIPYNEVWYTNGSTTEATTPDSTNAFGANIVSNTYDAAKECWVIKFDGKVTTIGEDAFYRCDSLTSVTIPDSVTTIGYLAFYYCDSLTSVTIGDSVTSIGERAFFYCRSLTSVTIPDSVTMIGDGAFRGCSSLQEFKGKFASEDGRCLIIDGVLNSFAIGCGATEYTIPDSVTTIGDHAFIGCRSLTSVTIGDSVTTIGEDAFYSCSSLTSVTIGDSVTTIGEDAFYNCTSLREFNGKYASEDGRCLIIDGTLNSFAPAGLTEYTIPDSVTTIGYAAFFDCSSLTSVTIGDSVTSIGGGAFLGCDSLTSVTIGDSVTTIGWGAFQYCYSLTSVTIPDSVTTIGNMAFYYCDSLTSVTIGDSVTTIEDSAFSACYSLTSVYCKAVTPPTGGYYMFYGNASGRKIYVPIGSVEAYKSAEGWSEYAADIVGYDFENGVVVTPKPANNEIWYTNGSTTEATTPYNTNVFSANIVSNTYDAAKECWVIKFDSEVTTIGDYAFENCDSLESVTIPDSVTTIGNGAFDECSSLESVTIPDSVTTIGYRAFYWCDSLTSVTIGDSVTTIGEWVFDGCSSLTSITIPDSVTTIGEGAFYSCDSLESVTIPDSVTTIGDGAFCACSNLTSVYCKAITPPAALLYNDYWYAFDCNAPGRMIYVPMESVEAYKSAGGWSYYADAIVGYYF